MGLEGGKAKAVHLKCWEEVVGQCKAFDKGKFEVSVLLGNVKIAFPVGSPEANILKKTVNQGWIGKKVGLMRTNVPEMRLLARLIE